MNVSPVQVVRPMDIQAGDETGGTHENQLTNASFHPDRRVGAGRRRRFEQSECDRHPIRGSASRPIGAGHHPPVHDDWHFVSSSEPTPAPIAIAEKVCSAAYDRAERHRGGLDRFPNPRRHCDQTPGHHSTGAEKSFTAGARCTLPTVLSGVRQHSSVRAYPGQVLRGWAPDWKRRTVREVVDSNLTSCSTACRFTTFGKIDSIGQRLLNFRQDRVMTPRLITTWLYSAILCWR